MKARMTRIALLLLCAGLLAACAPSSYLVLMPEEDGTIGTVQVSQGGQQTTLSAAHEGVVLGKADLAAVELSEGRINKDFAGALAAQPRTPNTFLLYFEPGGTVLTEESAALVADIQQALRERPAPDVSIIGHTDRAGDDAINEALALERANTVNGLLGDVLQPALEVTSTPTASATPSCLPTTASKKPATVASKSPSADSRQTRKIPWLP